MTAKDIIQLSMLYVEAAKLAKPKLAKPSVAKYYSVTYSDYDDELEFETHNVSNISEAIYQALMSMCDEDSIGNSSVYINDQMHMACYLSDEYDEYIIICNNGRRIKAADEDNIGDMLRSVTDNPASVRTSTQEFIDNYKRQQNYKKTALHGSNDEAGLGDMLDVL